MPVPNILGIDHVVYLVRDMPAMVRFYEQVLGARVERIVEHAGLYQIRAGNALIDLLDVAVEYAGAPDGPPPQGRNVEHVCLQILPWNSEDILAHLAMHGITDAEIGSRYGAQGRGPSIYIKDPEGNTIELKGPPWPPQPAA